MIQFVRAIAGVLWAPEVDRPRACFAPGVRTPRQRTSYGLLCFILQFINKYRLLTSATRFNHYVLSVRCTGRTHLRQCNRTENEANSSSIKIAYSCSLKPICCAMKPLIATSRVTISQVKGMGLYHSPPGSLLPRSAAQVGHRIGKR